MKLLNLAANWNAPLRYFRLLYAHRELTWELTKRECTERYAGQALWAFWILAHPLLVIGVYLFVFNVIYGIRLDLGSLGAHGDFSVYILAGLIPWLVSAEVLNKSTATITSSANLVKQVIFPVELLPAKTVFAAVITGSLLMALLLVYAALRFRAVPWTWSLLPFAMLVQTLGLLGLALTLSSLAVYLRDLKDAVQVYCFINIYLMPVVYLPAWVPAGLRPVLYLNPFSYQTWCYQDVLFYGKIAHPWAWPPFLILNAALLAVGYRLFSRLKTQFGNVL
jgi:lipopolysaccharide transport system permease protein